MTRFSRERCTTPSRSFRWRPRQTLVWWTGGKDSAWALHLLQQEPAWDVLGLITPVSAKNGRVLLHGVHAEMLEQQAAALGLPLQLVPVDWATSQQEREAAYLEASSAARAEGLEFVVFSNLSSAKSRERKSLGAGRIGMEAVFPAGAAILVSMRRSWPPVNGNRKLRTCGNRKLHTSSGAVGSGSGIGNGAAGLRCRP